MIGMGADPVLPDLPGRSVGTWAEHQRQHLNRLAGADRRFEEEAHRYALGAPQVAHLFPPRASEQTRRRRGSREAPRASCGGRGTWRRGGMWGGAAWGAGGGGRGGSVRPPPPPPRSPGRRPPPPPPCRYGNSRPV